MKKFFPFIYAFLFSFNLYAQNSQEIVLETKQDNALQLQATLSRGDGSYEITQGNNQLVINAPFLASTVPDDIAKASNLITAITMKNKGNYSTLTIDFNKPIQYYSWQIDNHLAIHMSPSDTVFNSQPISIKESNIPVSSLLWQLSNAVNANIIVSDLVKDNISLDFRNVPKAKVIELIIKTKQLGYLKNDMVYLIFPKTQAVRLAPLDIPAADRRNISLNFETIDITKTLLRVLSSFSKGNIVSSQANLGTLTIRVKDVMWSQVLADVVAIKGLSLKTMGNSIIVGY